MRCAEVVTSVLQDPTRVDQPYASVYRSLSDARRMLRKSESRMEFFRKGLKQYEAGNGNTITGPVHGMVTACQKIHSNIMATDHDIIITTPLGAELSLSTPHDTHFQAAIREACRYANMNELVKRSGKEDQSFKPPLRRAAASPLAF